MRVPRLCGGLLVILCWVAAGYGMPRLIPVKLQPGEIMDGARIFGRTKHFLLAEDGPVLVDCRLPGTPIEPVLDLPGYLVILEDGVALPDRVKPLLQDGNEVLAQMDDATARELRRAGAGLLRLPDEAYPMVSPPPRFRSAGFPFPDSFIQRVVNRVSADSVARRLRRLTGFRTRYSPTDSCRAAEQYVADYFTELGLDSVELDSYTGSGGTWRNVIGTLRGGRNPDAVVIIGGHLDATSECPETLAPGAEDNASGTCMAIEAARVLAQENPDFTVKFMAFTGEEQGLFGSQHVAQAMRREGVMLVGMLNFDMVAWPGGDWNVRIYSDSASEPLAMLEDTCAGLYTGLGHMYLVRGPFGSDQLPFQQQGFAGIAALEGGHIGYQWYHNSGDTFGNLSMPLAAEVARMGIATALSLMAIPAPTEGFRVCDAGTGTALQASWRPNPDRNLAGYKLYWGTTTRGYTDSVVVGPVTTWRIDGLQEGTRYYATLRAFDSTGNEGGASPEQSAVPGSIPLAPAGVGVMPFYYGLRVVWRSNAEADLAGYNLYRTTVPRQGYRRLNPTLLGDTAFRDSALMSDTTYYYVACAVDSLDNESPRSAQVRGKPLTLDHGILLVDETRDGNGQRGNPNDAQVDEFYHAVLHNYNCRDWDVAQQGVPQPGDVGPYSTIVWHSDDLQEQGIGAALAGLGNYLACGGRLWLTGWKPVYGLMNRTGMYPYSFLPGQFPFDNLHLNGAALSQSQDFIGVTGTNGYPDAAVDSLKALAALHGRLPYIEVEFPRDADTVLKFVSYSGDTVFQDRAVGIRALSGPGRVVFFGLPFYYLQLEPARAIARRVMEDLGEPYAVAEAWSPPSRRPGLTLHPNPARDRVTIGFSLASPQPVDISIYDIAGKRVRTVVRQGCAAGPQQVTWNRAGLAAGVYFCRLRTASATVTARLQLVD